LIDLDVSLAERIAAFKVRPNAKPLHLEFRAIVPDPVFVGMRYKQDREIADATFLPIP